MTNLLLEVFDSDSEKNYPVINLNPKTKVPQVWSIKAPGNDNLVTRLVSYMSEGDAIKQVKLGDKYAHVILMSMSAKGTPAELRGGLGSDPVGTMNTIFDTVYSVVKKNRLDAVMFRFPAKKMKGQEKVLQRIMQRIVMARTGGQFKVLDALYQFTGKHAYIFIYRKNKQLTDISGIPDINKELYTKVESNVGDVYVSKKTGYNVTKDEAIAGSIAELEKDRRDISVIKKTRFSRRQIASSQSMETDRLEDKDWEEIDSSASKFSAPATAEIIPEAEEIRLSITSKASRERSSSMAAAGIANRLTTIGMYSIKQAEKEEERIQKRLLEDIGDAPLTSVKSMQAYVRIQLDALEEYKDKYIQDQIKKQYEQNPEVALEIATNQWNVMRVQIAKQALQGYAKNVSGPLNIITSSRTPRNYSIPERQGIKEYCGSAYHDINNFLLGRYTDETQDVLDRKEVLKAIKNIDSAFENGDKLPEDITLWRSQTIRKPIYESLVRNKVFYFRNYVSTSLSPIIFGGWKGNQAVGLASDNTRNVLNVDKTEDFKTDELVVAAGQVEKASVGWAIEGASKINVIYPGDLSSMSGEMEVILPRGTMVKIDKITDASYNDGLRYSNQKFIQAEIMTSEQIDEAIVYDGDVLMESGELVAVDSSEYKLDFSSFVSSTKLSDKNKGLALLAEFIDIADTPERFVQG